MFFSSVNEKLTIRPMLFITHQLYILLFIVTFQCTTNDIKNIIFR